MKKKISIVTPSFNQGLFIEETIDSILSQGYSNLEYVIIDGGSTDNTVEIIKKYEKHLTYWGSEKDLGQSHAINKGLNHITGDIFNWINSDDYLAPKALEYINNIFSSTNPDILLTQSNIIENSSKRRIIKPTPFYLDSIGKTMGVSRVNQPGQWWRTAVINNFGPINQNLRYIMDLDWWYRYLLTTSKINIQSSEQITANFRIHQESKTVSESNAFNKERNDYYYSLALHYGLKAQAENLNELVKTDSIPLTNLPIKVDLEILEDAFVHFYALLCEEAYAVGNHKMALSFASLINDKQLNKEDQEMIDKIRMRARIPASIIKTAKKIIGRK